MKKMLLFLCCISAYSCLLAQKNCLHTEYAEKALSEHPEMRKKMASVEEFVLAHTGNHPVILSGETGSGSTPPSPIPVPPPNSPLPAVITIPVVVHIVYNNESQNLSEKIILSQIDALNKDYRNLNSDRIKIPSYFSALTADCGIEFKLANTDPNGYTTKGIVRKKTSVLSFSADDQVKFAASGGDDAWDASRYLNIWVCKLNGGVIGYSSIIGCAAANDGIVILHEAFGIRDNNTVYNRGRTATHEIGHWLNLRHIWGDAACGDDKVDDTPSQRSANRGCPSGKKMSCGTTLNGDLYMNFMDLTNDECMYMFTNGQRERMRCLFLPNGLRASLLSSNALAVSLIPQPGALPDDNGNEAEASSLGIYPNPATSTINIRSDASELSDVKTFTIYNHQGQPVRQCIIKGKTYSLDISHLANGIYFLKPTDGSNRKPLKFIKVN